MFEGTVEGLPRSAAQPYRSPADSYGSPRHPCRPSRLLSHRSDDTRHSPPATALRSGAGELEPDARLVLVARDAPPVRHLVDEHQAEPAGVERVRLLALGRDPAGAAGVADLDVRALA